MPAFRPAALLRAAAPAVAVAVLAGCASFPEPGGARLGETGGWSSVAGSVGNSSRIEADLPEDGVLEWSRPLNSPTVGVPATDGLGALFQTTNSESGCNYFSLSLEDGRKVWCNRLATAGPRVTPTVDGRGTTYLPQPGSVVTMSHEGERRWTTRTEGTPVSLTLLGDRHLLSISQFGTVQVFNSHTGTEIATSLRLTDFIGGVEPDHGLPWCEVGSRGCPVPTVAAVDTGSRTAYTTLWPTGSDTPHLVAVSISDDEERPEISELWRVPLDEGRDASPVVLSDDADEVYVSGEDGSLSGYSTADGTHLWTAELGYRPDTSAALTEDGLLVSGGRTTTLWRGTDDEHAEDAGPAPVVAVSTDGDDPGSEIWRRDDLVQLTNPAVTDDGDVVVAARSGDNGIALHVLDSGDGSTLRTLEVTGAEGPASGLSIDPGGQILLSVAVGRVYAFGPTEDD